MRVATPGRLHTAAIAAALLVACGVEPGAKTPLTDPDACVDCDSAGGDAAGDDTTGDEGEPDTTPDDAAADAAPDDAIDPPDATADAAPTEDAGPTDAGADSAVDAAPDASAGGDIPCEVATILEAACVSCHASPDTFFGAPMPLVTREHLLAPAATDRSRSVLELSVQRVNDDRSPMPPAPAPRLSDADVATLEAWLEAGAPAGAACGTDSPDAGADAGLDAATDAAADATVDVAPDVAADVAPDVAPDVAVDAEVDAGFDESACEWTVQFRASNGGGVGDTTEFTVPRSSNHYECFYFEPTWEGMGYGLRFRSVIDDPRVVHHWLLYAEDGAGTPGTRRGCSGSHEDATLIAGWAPGGDDWVMPPNVGLEMPSDTVYFVEIHYANPRNLDTTDSSGVEVCGTSTPREHAAGTHWLGTESILLLGAGNHRVTGTCTPELSEPAHILRSWPHMHRYGVRMESEIIRAGGAREELIDVPFAFDNQISHETPFTINPGDRITTTCHYTTDTLFVSFGPNTEQEMCYNFVVAWPNGAFNTGGGVRGGTENFCLR